MEGAYISPGAVLEGLLGGIFIETRLVQGLFRIGLQDAHCGRHDSEVTMSSFKGWTKRWRWDLPVNGPRNGDSL